MALSSFSSCFDFGPGTSVFTVGPSGSPAMKEDDALNAHVFWTDPATQIILGDSHDSLLIEPPQETRSMLFIKQVGAAATTVPQPQVEGLQLKEGVCTLVCMHTWTHICMCSCYVGYFKHCLYQNYIVLNERVTENYGLERMW